MNQFNSIIFLVLTMVPLICAHEIEISNIAIKNKLKEKKPKIEINFVTQVKIYCQNKPSVNFCSEQHIDIMLKIERKRVEMLELERQLKRMENEIVKKVFKIAI
jgi:hypothetical protein